MKKWHYFALIFSCLLLQLTFLRYFAFFAVKPNLILIALVISCLTLNWRWAIILGAFAGFTKQLLSINTIPLDVFFYPLVCFLVVRISRKVSFENNLLRMALVAAAVLLESIVTRAIVLSGTHVPFGIFLRTVFLEEFMSLLVTPILIKIIYGSR
jgi:rod shape-determining protein MreD